ncbi:MAG: class I SAM-dependent RNA methyltransferase [Microbacteriaceae bacterium]
MADVELEITNVAHGGVFVARHEGRVVFVSDAIPGERVLARISDERHARFWRAETLQVLEGSEHRRPHIWSAASVQRVPEDRAGGAEFGHIALPHQRELKRQVLTDVLTRMGRLTGPMVDTVTVEAVAGDAEADGLGWRTRVRLHGDADGVLGPYAARSHRVIPVDDLPLAVPAITTAIDLTKRMPSGANVDVVAPSAGTARVVTPGAGSIVERVGEREFRLDAAGFWQVHRGAARTLTAAVQHVIDPGRFDPAAANLDLYGGVGLLAAAVGDRFGSELRITSVESNSAATGFAVGNLADFANASALTDRVERYLRRLIQTSGRQRHALAKATVILDPPRSGAGRPVVEALAALHPAQIVYVACDPVALARDAALFAPLGYGVQSLRAFDLFPHTHHLETIALLTR